MIETALAFITTQFATNQLLIAGIGTVLSGTLLYLTRSIPQSIYLAIKRHFTIEFTILSKNDNYEDILEVLNSHKINFFSRNFSITENGKHVIPGIGQSFSWIGGRFISYNRSLIDTKMKIEEQTVMTIFSRNKSFIMKIVDMAKKETERQHYIYSLDGNYWDRNDVPYAKRSIDSIFIDEEIKKSIIDRINWFYENREWYLKRGITYKLCFCFYGTPGTGKTSLIRALASHFKKDIRFLDNLNNLNLINQVDEQSFLVMEDIDHLLVEVNREGKGEQSSSPTIQRLLNGLDGIKTPDGVVTFITTNNKENLPFALQRKGRVDEMIEIPPMGKKEAIKMFTTFFGESEFELVQTLPYDFSMIGARVQDIFMTSETPEEAAKALHNLDK